MLEKKDFQKLMELASESPEAKLELARIKIDHGDVEEGIKLYKKVARILWRKGELSRAVDIYKKITAIKPEDRGVQLSLGILYRQLGLLEVAKKTLSLIIRYDTKNVAALIELGLVCQKKGEIEPAIISFKRVTELNPHEAMAYEQLGDLYIKKDKPGDALKNYYSAAMAYSKQKNNNKATEICQKILQINPRYSRVFKLIKKLKNLASAGLSDKKNIRSASDTKILNPDNSNILANKHKKLGLLYTQQGRYSDAVGEYQEALRLTPEDANIYENLGHIFYKEHKDERALQWLDKACDIYSKTGDLENEIKIYEYMLKIRPEDHDIMGRLRHFYLKSGKMDKAIKITDELARIYTRGRLLDKAMILYEDLLDMIPDNDEIILNLIDIYQEILSLAPGNTIIRKKLIDRLLEIKDIENAVRELINLIKSYYEQGFYEDTIKTCEELTKYDPASPDAGNYKGKALTCLKRYEEAIKFFNDILEINPDNKIAREGREEALKAWSGSL